MGRLLSLVEQRISPSAQGVNWALYGMQSGPKTSTGKQISEQDAQGCSIVYACLHVLSETVASLPAFVFEKVSEDKRKRATDHPLYPLIHVSPNPEMVSMIFREIMVLHLASWGNFYANIVWDKTNTIKELWPLRPDRIEIDRTSDRSLIYKYTLQSGEERILTNDQVLHIPGFGFDGIQGYSPIAKNREAIGLAMAAEEYGARFFANDARPGIVLKHPGNLSEQAQTRLRTSWEKLHVGLENKHRLAILEEGMDISQVGFPPGDTQWIELRKMQADEIARIYRIPAPLVGIMEHSTFSNVEELTRHFAIHTIRPWLVRIEAVENFKLLKEFEREKFYVEHLMDAMMRADVQARFAAYATGRQWGWLSANDIRKLENQSPIDDGDMYLVPGNMTTAENVAKGLNQPAGLPGEQGRPAKGEEKPPKAKKLELIKHSEEEQELEERATDDELKLLRRKARERQSLETSFEPLFRSCFTRICNRENLALEKAIKKHVRDFGDDLRRVMDDLYNDKTGKMRDYIMESYDPVLRAYASVIQSAAENEIEDFDTTKDLTAFLDEYLQSFADAHVKSSRNQLEDLMSKTEADKQADILIERINEWKEKRANKISSDQLIRSSNAVAHQVFFFSVWVSALVWISRGKDSCPYCQSLNGKSIKRTGSFVKAGETLTEREHSHDGEECREKFQNYGIKRHPPLHRGCVCTIAPRVSMLKPRS